MAQNKIFNDDTEYKSRYYSRKPTQKQLDALAKGRKIRQRNVFWNKLVQTQGKSHKGQEAHDNMAKILELAGPDERDNIRDLYIDDTFFDAVDLFTDQTEFDENAYLTSKQIEQKMKDINNPNIEIDTDFLLM
jgi:hypothetical protein